MLANAVKTTKINIGIDTFELQPSLRAAYLLAIREGGFEALLKQLSENSVSAMHDVIQAAAGDEAARCFMNAINARPLSKIIFDADAEFGLSFEPPTPLNERLIAFILALLDIQADEKSTNEAPSNSQPQDFAKQPENLFEIGTGWLSWTPEQTWNAAPAEIVSAHRGRMALLRAIFGSKKEDDKPQEPDFSRDPDAGATLRILSKAI